jgi:hypothetical protein
MSKLMAVIVVAANTDKIDISVTFQHIVSAFKNAQFGANDTYAFTAR